MGEVKSPDLSKSAGEPQGMEPEASVLVSGVEGWLMGHTELAPEQWWGDCAKNVGHLLYYTPEKCSPSPK